MIEEILPSLIGVVVTRQLVFPCSLINPVFGIKDLLSLLSVTGKQFILCCFSSQTKLTKLHITCEGTIEDDGHGMLQVRHRGGSKKKEKFTC